MTSSGAWTCSKPREVALPKNVTLDLSDVLRDPDPGGSRARRSRQRHNDRPEKVPPLDERLWLDAQAAIEQREPVRLAYPVHNGERSVGARVSGEIARLHGEAGLPPGSLRAEFQGAAGQSFGAFTNHGMHLRLIGEAQDYVGKGMAGGEIAVLPPAGTTRAPDGNVIVGNTVLYGATGGSLYAAGKAGERLCVRNSGARRGRRGLRRPRLRVHDRRRRCGARAHRPQLRRRHVRRDRLRSRRRRGHHRPHQPRHGAGADALGVGRRTAPEGPARAPPDAHRLPAWPRCCSEAGRKRASGSSRSSPTPRWRTPPPGSSRRRSSRRRCSPRSRRTPLPTPEAAAQR